MKNTFSKKKITPKQLREIILKAKGKKVLALGDVMLDAYLSGKVERFSQEAPVPVVAVKNENFFPGGAGNSTACMAAIGLRPTLLSVIGTKEKIKYSEILIQECHRKKIKPIFLKDKSRKPTLKLRIAATKTTKQHIVRVDIEDDFPLDKKIEAKILEKITRITKRNSFQAISIHDYQKGFLTKKIFDLICKLSKKYQIPVFADLKQKSFVELKNLIKSPNLFFLKPNRNESAETAKLLNGFEKEGYSDKEIVEIGQIIQKEIPINIIITRGKKGAVLFEPSKKPYFIRLKEVEEQFDVAGAGDTVEAFLVASFLGGASLPQALEIAIAASQVAIRKFGTSIVTGEELEDWIKKYPI